MNDKWTKMSLLSSAKARRSSVIASADRRLVRLGVYRSDSRPLGKLQSLLAAVAVTTGALFLLVGAVTMWDNHGGSGSVGVDILWWFVWIVYTFAKVTLIVVAVATIRQWFISRPRRSSVRS